MPPERMRIKMSQEEEDLSAAKPERGRLRGDPWGQVQSSKKIRGQTGTSCGLESQRGVDNMNLKGSQQEGDGLQRGTLIRYVVPMRAVNVTPVVGNVEP